MESIIHLEPYKETHRVANTLQCGSVWSNVRRHRRGRLRVDDDGLCNFLVRSPATNPNSCTLVT
jgi:hypothetical protein